MPKPLRLSAALLTALAALAPVACFNRAELPESTASANAEQYLFCFWNVENLFDDRDDGRTGPGDREYDHWFARDPQALKLKLDHLSDALLQLNGGKGPDILAVVEVEGLRAADLLRQALNRKLPDPALQYEHILMKELEAGRHIAPAILTRLPVRADKTRLHGHRQRILEAHVEVNGHDLVIVASHWTSRLTDKDGRHRADYADQIYGLFRAMSRANPAVDLLICGDFNDPPDAESARVHLHATGDVREVLGGGKQPLLNLFDNPRFATVGTHYDRGHWYLFDQIVVSPGMLDDLGWSCDPASAQIVTATQRHGRPWRFGNEHDDFNRGYSDHFLVTVRLRVGPPE